MEEKRFLGDLLRRLREVFWRSLDAERRGDVAGEQAPLDAEHFAVKLLLLVVGGGLRLEHLLGADLGENLLVVREVRRRHLVEPGLVQTQAPVVVQIQVVLGNAEVRERLVALAIQKRLGTWWGWRSGKRVISLTV